MRMVHPKVCRHLLVWSCFLLYFVLVMICERRFHVNILPDHLVQVNRLVDGKHREREEWLINLVSGGTEKAWPDNDRIFFVETSGNTNLSLRQTCAVESAAKANPMRKIQLFLTAKTEIDPSSPFLEILRRYPNIAIYVLDLDRFFRHSALQGWYEKGTWRSSQYSVAHLSDYVRALFLHKGGGFYMDLDFVTLKELDRTWLWNFVPVEYNLSLTLSVGHLEHGHPIVDRFLDYLLDHYDSNVWAKHGPEMITTVIRHYCKFTGSNWDKAAEIQPCPDVRIIDKKYFYPILWDEWYKLFEMTSPKALSRLKESYAVHYWNKLSSKTPIQLGSTQILAMLSSIHCPVTIEMAYKE